MQSSSKPLRSLTSLCSTPATASTSALIKHTGQTLADLSSQIKHGMTPTSTKPNHGVSPMTWSRQTSRASNVSSSGSHRLLLPTKASLAQAYNYDAQAENLRYLQQRDPKIYRTPKATSSGDVSKVTERLASSPYNVSRQEIQGEHVRRQQMFDPRARKAKSKNLNDILRRLTKPTVASTAASFDFDNQDANLAYLRGRDSRIALPYKTDTHLRISDLPQERVRAGKLSLHSLKN